METQDLIKVLENSHKIESGIINFIMDLAKSNAATIENQKKIVQIITQILEKLAIDDLDLGIDQSGNIFIGPKDGTLLN
jgi:hypothetical protein